MFPVFNLRRLLFIFFIGRVFCCKNTKNHNLQLNLSNSYFILIILISLVEQKVNIPGMLINYIEDSFISYQFSINLANQVKKYSYWYTWITCSSEIFQTINQLTVAIFKRNLSYNLMIIFFKTSQNRKSSVAASLTAKSH